MERKSNDFYTALVELKELLVEENEILKRLDMKALQELLPRKISLLNIIDQTHSVVDENGLRKEKFKKVIEDIRTQNERNRFFVEEALKVYTGLLSVILPSNYTPEGLKKPCLMPGIKLNQEA